MDNEKTCDANSSNSKKLPHLHETSNEDSDSIEAEPNRTIDSESSNDDEELIFGPKLFTLFSYLS